MRSIGKAPRRKRFDPVRRVNERPVNIRTFFAFCFSWSSCQRNDEQRVQLSGDPTGSHVGQHVRRVGVHVVHGPAGSVHPIAVRHRRPVRPPLVEVVTGPGVRLHRRGRRHGGQRRRQPTQRGKHDFFFLIYLQPSDIPKPIRHKRV